MKPENLLEILHVAEKLKCNTRHCDTTSGRRESVAEHSWRASLMAMLLSDEFPEADMNRVIKMCIIHDLGEAFTGDIPTFVKTDADALKEDDIYEQWIETFPEPARTEFFSLVKEIEEKKTLEYQIYKAIDKMEAVIQHNESDIRSWLPLEYDLQRTYGTEEMQFSEYTRELKRVIDEWTERKIREEGTGEIPQ